MHRAESPFEARAATRRSETLDGTDLPRSRRARRRVKLAGAPPDLDRLNPRPAGLSSSVGSANTSLAGPPSSHLGRSVTIGPSACQRADSDLGT